MLKIFRTIVHVIWRHSLSQLFCQLCYLVLCILSCVETFDPRRICSILSTGVQSVSVCQEVTFLRYTRVLSGTHQATSSAFAFEEGW